MKSLIVIVISFIGVSIFGQELKLPDNPYVLVIGNDKYYTETVIEQSPNLRAVLNSGLKGHGIILSIDARSSDSTDQKPLYANGDSLRVMTYLFKGENYRISFPQRIDTTKVLNIITDSISIRIDTTDHIDFNKFVKTINKNELTDLLDTEIEVFQGSKKLVVRRISITIVLPDGLVFSTNFEQVKIGDYEPIAEGVKNLPTGAYLAIDRIWFYNELNEQYGISGSLCWKIE